MKACTPTIAILALLALLPVARAQTQQPAAPAAPADAGAAPSAPAPAEAAPTTPAAAPVESAPSPTPAPSDAAASAPASAEAATVAPADTPAPAPADTPAAATAPKASEAVAAAAPTKGKDGAGRDTLSVDFPDEDVRNILRNVADLFELNLIMPDTLQGKTTIKLRDVTWRQIFQSVLAPVNYTYVEEGNIIKIVSNESLQQEPVSTEVFLINYAKASEILPTITSLIDSAAGGKIVVDARSNSLVITERPSRMNRVRPIIELLDRATDQVMIESKFVEVSDADVKNIGVNWSSLANFQLGAGQLGGNFSRSRDNVATQGFDNQATTTRVGTNTTTGNNTNTVTNGLVTTTTSGQTSGSTNTGSVTSTGGNVTSTSTTGTNGSLTNGVTSTGTNGNTTTRANGVENLLTDGVNNAFKNLGGLLNTSGTGRALNAVFSASDFNIVLSALQSMQKTKIVSNPTIVTLNNTQAVINVGQERPIPSYTYNAERGVYEVSGFTYKPIGVILKVTPQVNARGYIKLTVEPEVSQSNRDASFNGAQIPIVESRKANTTVSLKDGFTMGIGGLMQQASTNGQNKVPVLGNMPVLGRLFRSDSKNVETTNLIIFITAKTLSAEGGTVEQVFDSARVRGLDMRREDLPGHRDGSNPFLPSVSAAAVKGGQ
ncbi:MAG: secretin and TonB N-terminal domain-containing protein [Opitutaceae bacterium]|nr:secretin and TonB N-terminal domain-containing protein [Opitutaceae bacterium]